MVYCKLAQRAIHLYSEEVSIHSIRLQHCNPHIARQLPSCHDDSLQRVTIGILLQLHDLQQRCTCTLKLLNARKPAPGVHVD